MSGRCITYLVGVFLVFQLSINNLAYSENTMIDQKAVTRAATLSLVDLRSLVDAIGKRKDTATLRAIANANFEHSYVAAKKLSQVLDASEAIAYCSSLSLNSMHWRTALMGLTSHPKTKIIGYICQISTSSNQEVRWWCYRVCAGEGWDDLVNIAQVDLGNTAPLFVDGLNYATIGEAAKEYIDNIAKVKSRKSEH